MKNILIVLILLLILIASCTKGRTSTGDKSGTSSGSAADCGSDFGCLADAAETCSLAKLTKTETRNIQGYEITAKTYFEIKGMESNKCLLYLKTEKIDVVFPPETTEQQISDMKAIYKQLEGRDGTCRFDQDNLVIILSKWKDGLLSTSDLKGTQCEGPYFKTTL